MPAILQNHYVLAVHNVRSAAAWFVDMLDFRIVAQPDGWIFVAKDNCMLMLGECPDDLPAKDIGSHSYFAYLVVDDADGCYRMLAERGADLLSEIADKPWKMREFGVRTPEGHRILIGQRMGNSGQ